MTRLRLFALTLAGLLLAAAGAARAQACEGGAYQNPQLFRGEAAYQGAVAQQELHAFIGRTGLPPAPLYAIKRVDDVTASGRAPYCWIYSNAVLGLLSGYKPVAVNAERVHPAVLAITQPMPSAPGAGTVALKSLPAAEQQAILDRLTRSKCLGTAGGVEAAIVRAEGLCGRVEDVAAQAALGQQGLIAKAAYDWEEAGWTGLATRQASALQSTLQGLAGRSDKLQQARLVVVPTRNTSFGFGLYVHASVPEPTAKKALLAFQQLAAPSKPLATALDLGPDFRFVVPTPEQLSTLTQALGLQR